MADITYPQLPAASVTGNVEWSAEHPQQRAALLAALAATLSTDTVLRSAETDYGSTVGTTAVTMIPANATRRGFIVQNQSATATVYISTLGTATADCHSLMIGPGGTYETNAQHVATGGVSIIATAENTPVYSREF